MTGPSPDDPFVLAGSPLPAAAVLNAPIDLGPDAVVSLEGTDEIDTDILVIGSGMGGGTLAWALRDGVEGQLFGGPFRPKALGLLAGAVADEAPALSLDEVGLHPDKRIEPRHQLASAGA